jgi:hypothetical protein
VNLRGIANTVSQVVNPNILVTVRKSTGFTIGAGRKQVPTYSTTAGVVAQLQALDNDMIKHIDSLNIQGTVRNIRMFGNLLGVIRPLQEGGDLIDIVDAPGIPGASSWLVVKVMENWPHWTSCMIVLQEIAE